MLQRVMAVVLAVLGAASLVLAIASATLWRPDDVVTASVAPPAAVTMLVAEPGVLGLVGDDVTVTATRSDGGPVAVVVGREADVRGWVGDDAHVQVTGLSSWTDLATTAVAGETTPVPEPSGDAKDDETPDGGDATEAPAGGLGLVGADPIGSDMWLAQEAGDGTATLTLSEELGREMLLVAGTGDGAAAPTLTISWPRAVSTPALVPGVVLGIVLLLAAAALFLLPRLPAFALRLVEARRARRGVASPVQVAPDAPHGGPIVAPTSPFATARVVREDSGTGAATPQLLPLAHAPALEGQADEPSPGEPGGRPLTRRELRERAEREAAEAARDRGRKRPRTGMLPQVRSRVEPAGDAPAPGTSPQAGAEQPVAGAATTSLAPGEASAAGAAPSQRGGDENPSARADAWRAAWGFQAGAPRSTPSSPPAPEPPPAASWSPTATGDRPATPRPPTPQPHQQLRQGAAASPYERGTAANPYQATPATTASPTWAPEDEKPARTEEDA